jgi:hypothetical protein
MVGRRDHHHVDVLLRDHFTIIAIQTGLLPGCLTRGDEVGRVREHFLVDVTERHHRGRDRRRRNRLPAVPSGADETDAEGCIGGEGGGDIARGGGECGGGGGLPEEIAAGHGSAS